MSTTHPFTKKKEARYLNERMQKVFLFLATYAILIFTLFVFWEIIAKGAPVLKQHGWEFIKRKPETLEVISYDAGKKLQVPAETFKTLLTYNPEEDLVAEVSEVSRENHLVRFQIEPGSFIGDGYLSQIEKYNKEFKGRFKSRSETALVGFSLSEEAEMFLTPSLHAQLVKAFPEMASQPSETIEREKKHYELTFTQGEYQMQAKTILELSESELIYKLYGNLTDTVDDNPGEKMNLFIPRTQSVELSPAQYAACEADTGNAQFTEPIAKTTSEPMVKTSLPAGDYNLPFTVFKNILDEVPSLSLSHQHNLDLGVIELDLNAQSAELIFPKAEFDKMKQENPELSFLNVSHYTEEIPYIQFNLTRAAELKLPTTDMSALRSANTDAKDEYGQPLLNVLNEHVYPYSGGGVAGPVWGTALLVITCMLIGLVIGVGAAIYLGEYSRKGNLISVIRLSMMNLAGVPSIVFGIFGLGLFVSLAPKLTDTPSINDKVKLALFPSFSEPDLRTQERAKIIMIQEKQDLKYALRAAQQQGMERYYTGWTYLSFQGWGNSIIAGAFTLAIMVLPIIITSSEESLKAVPRGFREASLALGATKWQAIKTAVLPYATPGILTASVLGITRVAGETAPIMFTAAVAAKTDLPFKGLQGTGFQKFLEFISQSVQAMPYHIYTISGRLPPSHHIKPMQYGSVLVFMIIVMIFAALSVWLRIRMRKKYKW